MKNSFITPHQTKHISKFLVQGFFFFLLILPLIFTACGPTLKAGAPLIKDFNFVGQTNADPRIFCFSLEWKDDEGDLSSEKVVGQIRIKVQDLSKTNSEPKAISPIKLGPELVTKGSTTGIFSNICLKLEESTGEWPGQIKVFAQLLDILGNESNQAWVIIQIRK